MALFIVSRPRNGQRNSMGQHACLVDAIDAAAARTAVAAKLKVDVRNWNATEVSAGSLSIAPDLVVFEGDCLTPAAGGTGITRGGNGFS